MIQTFDWDGMIAVLQQEIMSITGLPADKMITDGYSGNKPAYPFITVSPQYNTVRDRWAHSPSDESFETTVSITVHSNIKSQAGRVMDNLQAVLREYTPHHDLSAKGIVLLDVLDPTNRTSLGTIVSDYQFGFDLQLRLQRDFENTTPMFSDYDDPSHSLTNEEGN